MTKSMLDKIKEMNLSDGTPIEVSFWTGDDLFDLFRDHPHKESGYFKAILDFPGIAPTLRYTSNDKIVEHTIKYVTDIKILEDKK